MVVLYPAAESQARLYGKKRKQSTAVKLKTFRLTLDGLIRRKEEIIRSNNRVSASKTQTELFLLLTLTVLSTPYINISTDHYH